jgi:steroid 5-alpha reductase family enzyme
MIRTVLFLIITLTAVVYFAFISNIFDISLNDAQMNALIIMTKLYLASCLYCFVVSELAENYSQVDKFWSTIPIVYVWYFAIASDMNSRMVLMAILGTLWGVRLTLNFARKGGFSIYFWKGEEDYRWVEVRKKMPFLAGRFTWALFNLFFMCLYQMGLIFLFTLPILAAWQGAEVPLYWADYLIAFFMFLFIVLETISDQQQYDFQTKKYQLINSGKKLEGDYKLGFRTSGLWALSRHPNFACEQAIWVIFYLFSVSATGLWLNWSIIGCFLLIILFYNSANFSEEISSRKYSDYKKYIKNVPMFFPILGIPKKDWK